jgi:hypothetical protein
MSKKNGLEVNVEKTKYMFMSCGQNAEKYHNINITNKSFDSMVDFIYLGTIVKNMDCIHEEINSRLNTGILATTG